MNPVFGISTFFTLVNGRFDQASPDYDCCYLEATALGVQEYVYFLPLLFFVAGSLNYF